jgi:hypothetical protein
MVKYFFSQEGIKLKFHWTTYLDYLERANMFINFYLEIPVHFVMLS